MPWGYTKAEGEFPSVPAVPVIKPQPERVAGKVFPYRGIEQHGVADPDVKIDYPDDTWPEDTIAAIAEPKPEPDPVPVRIVRSSSREIRDWRTRQTTIGPNSSMIVGRNDDRKTVRIRNTHATVAAYIGNASNTTTYSGYPLAAGAEIQIESSEEIYGLTADGTTSGLVLAVLEELVVEVHCG